MREDDKEEPIYERIAPGEIFVLYGDKEGYVYIGNKGGEAFVGKVYWKDKEEKK